MRTEVSILHHEYPSAVRDVVGQKLQNLDKYFRGTHSLRAVIEKQHDLHRVELVAQVPRGQVLVIDARAATFGEAMDGAVDRMARALAKYKDKLATGGRRAARDAS